MNRLLYQAATAATTTTSVGLPGIFRLDMSLLRRLIGQGRALLRYHLQVYGNKSPILGKLDPIGRTVGTQGTNSIVPRNSTSPLDWIGKELHAHFR